MDHARRVRNSKVGNNAELITGVEKKACMQANMVPTKRKAVAIPSYFKLQVRWLRSLTRITYYSKLIGIHSLAILIQFE